MQTKSLRVIKCLSKSVIILVFVFLIVPLTSAEPVNYKSGIDVTFGGTRGVDWDEEVFWYKPIEDSTKVVYIKDDTLISMAHNERAEMQTNSGNHITVGTGSAGQIRYCVDRDWQLNRYYWGKPRNATDHRYPAYAGPFSFSQLTYGTGFNDDASAVPVVGSTGHNNAGITVDGKTGQIRVTDRRSHYQYGQLDAFGDEWHQMTLASDDTDMREAQGLTFNENHASDGTLILFVVNPRTPCIKFSVSGDGQFYTTPAKIYQVPKIHTQTTYISNGVSFVLTNVTNTDAIFYRFGDSGDFTEYTGPVSLDGMADGEHELQYYFDSNHIKTRKIVKNPAYPSDADNAIEGFQHGYLFWENDAKFNEIKALCTEATDTENYNQYIGKGGSSFRHRADYPHLFNTEHASFPGSPYGGKGSRRMFNNTGVNALIARMENFSDTGELGGSTAHDCAVRAKALLLDNATTGIPDLGVIVANGQPNPGIVLWRRGYYDISIYLNHVFAYNLLIKDFRATDRIGGITPIEDYKIRDSLARMAHLSMQNMGNYTAYSDGSGISGMWGAHRAIAAYIIALALPAYNTSYYGTSGFDGTEAAHTYAPFPNQAISWKEIYHLETKTDESPIDFLGFPNIAHPFGIHELFLSGEWERSGGYYADYGNFPAVTLPAGSGGNPLLHPDAQNRVGYFALATMGGNFQILANVLKISPFTQTRSFPYMDAHFLLANPAENGEPQLYGTQVAGSTDVDPIIIDQPLLVNERFPNVALGAKAYLDMRENFGTTLFGQNVFGLVFYNPAWQSYNRNVSTLSASAINGSVLTRVNGAVTTATSFAHGTVLDLTAVPAADYKFGGWEDAHIDIADQVYRSTQPAHLTESIPYKAITTEGWSLAGTTITLWFMPRTTAGTQYLLGHTDSQTAGTWTNCIQLYIENGQLGLGLGNSHTLNPTIAALEPGHPYLVTLTFGNGLYKVYLDDSLRASGTYTGLTTLNPFADLGNTGNTASRDAQPFEGVIDEVRVFASVLELAQVQTFAQGRYRNLGAENPLSLTVTDDIAIRAWFTRNPYTLSTTAQNGTVARSPNKESYTDGEVVTLTATPTAGYTFSGWSGGATGTDNPLLLTLRDHTSVTATFAPIAVPTYTVTFNLDGKGTRTGGGALTQTVAHGSAATAPTVTANTGWVFTGWDKTFNNITSNLTVNAVYTAQNYTLGIAANNGSVTKRVNGIVTTATTFAHGTVVTLTAAANTGYTFANWSGNATGTANPVSITMDGNKSVTANFTQQTYTLGIAAANGNVTKQVNGVITTATSFAHGTVVTLTAAANTGYTFANWSGSATGTANPVSITMDGNKSVTANFTQVSLVLGPVAQWLFNEPYKSTLTDIVSGQTANLVNQPEWGEGWAQSYTVRFGSGRQAVQIPMHQCSNDRGTIALRITPETVDSMQILFGHAIANNTRRIALYLSAGNLAVNIGDALQGGIMALTPGQSYHIALTWDTTQYNIFVDGVSRRSGTFSGLAQLEDFADVGNYGNAENRDNGLGFRGLVEEIQLYAYALNAAEIKTLVLTHHIKENRAIEFIVSGQDELGNPISYTASNLPQGAVFNVATQTFSWRPASYNTAGKYSIVFNAPGQPDQTVSVVVQEMPLTAWYETFMANLTNK